MLEFTGSAMTDQVNLYNEKFPLPTILSAYEQVWDEGVPSFLNHDHRKHIGWTKLSGIYLEPQTAVLTNTIFVGETDEEKALLQKKSASHLYQKMYLDRRELYDKLKTRIGDKLTEHATPCWVNAVSWYDVGIVKRLIPGLESKCKKGLIPLKELNYIQPGIYELDGWLLFAHRFFRRGFSYMNTMNEAFLERLQKYTESHNAQIAIDMDCIGLLGTQSKEAEYQYWWGPKFTDDLTQIPSGVTVYDNEHYDGLLSDILKTEFGWYIQDDIQTFECEEITDIANIQRDKEDYYGCRFVHSMVNSSGQPYHLDGAIRIYSTEKMLNRLECDIRHSGRDTDYHKMWRVDGDIDVALWKELITHFYRDNILIGEYFGGKDEKLDLRHSKTNNIINPLDSTAIDDFIPANMEAGDGLRINVSFSMLECLPNEFNLLVRPTFSYINTAGEKIKFYESDTDTFIKYLRKEGITVRIPFCKRIATYDTIYNFPMFVCQNEHVAQIVQEKMAYLCQVWKSQRDNRLISYTLRINYRNKSLTLSFAGHVNDFCDFYESVPTIPRNEEAIQSWVVDSYNFLNHYPEAKNRPSYSKLLNKGGILSFPKKFVDSKYIDELSSKEKGLYAKLKVQEHELNIFTQNGVWVAPMYFVNSSRCSNCHKEYRTCCCCKFTDDIAEELTDLEYIGMVWTNRSALPEFSD